MPNHFRQFFSLSPSTVSVLKSKVPNNVTFFPWRNLASSTAEWTFRLPLFTIFHQFFHSFCLTVFVDGRLKTRLPKKEKELLITAVTRHNLWNFKICSCQALFMCSFYWVVLLRFLCVLLFCLVLPRHLSKECHHLCLTTIWSLLCCLYLSLLWRFAVPFCLTTP